MKKLSFAVAVGSLTFALCAAQQGEMIGGEYVITVAADAADVTLNGDDVSALGSNVNLVKKGEGRLVIARDLAGWVGELRVEAGYVKADHAGACGHTAYNAASGGVVVKNGGTIEINGNVLDNSSNNMACKKWQLEGAGVGGTAGAVRLLNKSTYWYGAGAMKFTDDTTFTASASSLQLDMRGGNTASIDFGGHTITIDGIRLCVCNPSKITDIGDFVVKNGGGFVTEQADYHKTAKKISFENNTLFKATRPTNFAHELDFAGASTWNTQAWADDILKPLNKILGSVKLGGIATVALNKSSSAGGASGTEYNTMCVLGPVSGSGGFKVTAGWLVLDNPTNSFSGTVTVNGANAHVCATSPGALPALTNGNLTVTSGTVEVQTGAGFVPSPENDAYLLGLYRHYPTLLQNGSLSFAMPADYRLDSDIDASTGSIVVPHAGSGTLTLNGRMTGDVKFVNQSGVMKVTGTGPHAVTSLDVQAGTLAFDGAGEVAFSSSLNYVGADWPGEARLSVSNSTLAYTVAKNADGKVISGGTAILAGRSQAKNNAHMRGIVDIGTGGCVSNAVSSSGGDKTSMGSVFVRGGRMIFPCSNDGTGQGVGAGQHGYLRMDSGEIDHNGYGFWFDVGHGSSGYGVYEQNGGAWKANSRPACTKNIGSHGSSVIRGGTFNVPGGYIIGRVLWGGVTAQGGEGRVTIDGTAEVTIGSQFQIGGVSNSVSMLNLNGGTLTCSRIQAITNNCICLGGAANWPAPFGLDTAQRYLYFNGGTLKTCSANNNKIIVSPEMSRVTVGPGGALFDTDGRDYSLPAKLEKPSGKGVSRIPFSCSEPWKYAGSPFVKIEGDGHGASAHVEFDPDTGTITGVTVTSPGNDYTQATATIQNGGWTNTVTVTLTDDCFAANDTTGGLVKKGGGTLTLNAENTYEGPTVVEAGTLKLGVANAISEKSALGAKAGATIDLNGKTPTVGGILPGGEGTITGDLTISGTWTVSAADLVTRKCPTVNGRVTIAAGTRIVVEDPDHLLENPDNQRSYRLFNATAMTVNGPVTVGGDVDDQWRVINGGNNLRLSFMRGLQIIVR